MRKAVSYWPIIPAVGLYAYIADYLKFIQDDAYITFRYVANYLNGDGLVFNIGERIEGFTNFGWTIYLLLWGSLGFDYIAIAAYSGLIFGGLSLFLIFIIARDLFGPDDRWFSLLALFLVAVNFSFAYWSPAGLETAAFTFLTLLSVRLYLKRNWLLAAALALAVWVRPEGALLAIIFVFIEALLEKRLPKFAITAGAIAFVISIPFLIFKVTYYGSILPNPFYAKTSFDFEQLTSGLEYAGRYFLDYGFVGIGFLITALNLKRLSYSVKVLWLFSFAYLLYIVLVGGDVLKVHRFFLPIFGITAMLVAVSVRLILEPFRAKSRYLLLVVAAIPLLWLTYRLPLDFVTYYNDTEKTFVSKMDFISNAIKDSDSTNFSVAIATIGKLGYELVGHEVIDIIGLTDSTIARHSNTNIEGLKTTWKERKYNIPYILAKAPDYIVFSTGIKPSAPAEKALYMYPAFFLSYVPIPWSDKEDPSQLMGIPTIAFKKVRPIVQEFEIVYDLRYVEYFKLGMEKYFDYDYAKALKYFDSALAVSQEPHNPFLMYEIGFCLGKLNQIDASQRVFDEIVKNDSFYVFAHRDLYVFSFHKNDSAKGAIHRRWLERLVPWYWPEIKAVVEYGQSKRKSKRKP
ncbi:MAG: hypothetical protein IID63_03335 [candidate division Zixibacteria bacterium]|nr:hypothetical protein [candidate division Zixibacteria bacterium]